VPPAQDRRGASEFTLPSGTGRFSSTTRIGRSRHVQPRRGLDDALSRRLGQSVGQPDPHQSYDMLLLNCGGSGADVGPSRPMALRSLSRRREPHESLRGRRRACLCRTLPLGLDQIFHQLPIGLRRSCHVVHRHACVIGTAPRNTQVDTSFPRGIASQAGWPTWGHPQQTESSPFQPV